MKMNNLNHKITKIIIAALIIILTLGFVGCSKNTQSSGIVVEDIADDSAITVEEVNTDSAIATSEGSNIDNKKKELEEEIKKYQEELLKQYYNNGTDDNAATIKPNAPVFEDNGEYPIINVYEGERVALNLKASDPDGDRIRYRFSKPLDANGEWLTEFGDAGQYIIQINASDSESMVTKYVKVIVINRPPVMEEIPDMRVYEGEYVVIEPVYTDPEGDKVIISYTGWMNSSQKVATYDDQGEHLVTVTANDGNSQISQSVKVTIIDVNRPPVMERIDNITVTETETIKFNPVVRDPEGDDIVIYYSGWMDSDEYTTDYDDAGEYLVTIAASDGLKTVSQKVIVTVLNKNRPPSFDIVI